MDTSAPDECSYHYTWGDEIVKLDDKGNCPKQDEHSKWGPGSHFA